MAKKRTSKAVNLILILILGIACVFGILWFIPKWQVDTYIHSEDFLKQKEPIELENDTRRTWAQILGGAFFLITAYFTWRNLQIAKEGQITERFTKAIDQLGDKEHLEVRLGGIYALERIARDSKKDHWTIMEVLSSYVRIKAPWRGKAEQTKEKGMSKGKKSKESPESSQMLPDIQTILTILGRRTLSHEKGEVRNIDLMKTDLRMASLFEANFENAILWEANLENAILWEVNLSGAELSEADLRKTKLYKANLSGAGLFGADLRGANLTEANLTKADLIKADLRGANLTEADLKGAYLEEADLRKTKLYKANLRGAHYLTIKQLSEVKTLYEAELDSELMEQIKKKYPHLLEKPKPEE